MSRSGQGAGRPPPASIAAGSSRSAAQPGDSGFDAQAALGLVGLGVVGHVLRSRRFYERVVLGAIVLGALRGLGQDSRASTLERLRPGINGRSSSLSAKLNGRPGASSARLRGKGPHPHGARDLAAQPTLSRLSLSMTEDH